MGQSTGLTVEDLQTCKTNILYGPVWRVYFFFVCAGKFGAMHMFDFPPILYSAKTPLLDNEN